MHNDRKVQVSVVIVNYNTCALLRDCLRSVYEKTKDISFEVIVSDNGSVDGSIEMLREEFPQVVLVENNANLGFGTANNRGLDVAQGEYVFYLNSDTLLLNNAIKLFYENWTSGQYSDVGAMGCTLVDADGVLTESYGAFPRKGKMLKAMFRHTLAFYVKNVMKLFRMDISRLRPVPSYKKFVGEVDYVTGADLFMRNDSHARFDENFFLYFEETDMQLRASKAGLKRYIVDGPQVMHLIRGGQNKTDDVIRYGSFSIIQSEISRVRYMKKHLSRFGAFLLKSMISIQWMSPYIFKNTKKHFKTLWSV